MSAYLNTQSGLTSALDAVAQLAQANSQNNAQLRGLAAGGIIPQSAAPSPGILSQLIGGVTGSPAQSPAPAAQPVSLGPQGAGAPGPAPQPMAYADPGSAPGGNSLFTAIGQTAQKYGIDPMTAIRVAMAEGGKSGGYGANGTGDGGSSFSPFQLHYGGVAGGGNSSPGLGDDFTAATGLDARDPKNALAAIDFALKNAAKNGWGAFHGAAKAGIGTWQGIQGGGQQPSAGGAAAPMPQATASGPMPPQAMAFAGNQPSSSPAAPPASPQGGAAVAAPGAAASSTGGAGPGAPAPQAGLPGIPSMQQIQALIQNPATRDMGLQLWQTAISPKPTFKLSPGESEFDYRGRPLASVAPAPVPVAAGTSLVSPQNGQPLYSAPPKLEPTKTGTDVYGQPEYGSFNPLTGAVAPFPGAPGVVPAGAGSPQPAGGAASAQPPTGAAFLSTLPPVLASQVQAIAEGRMKMPAAGSRSPMAARLASMVSQYDPTFDQANAEARFGTRESWAHGPVSQTLVAGNTAIQHLGDLSDAAEALNNGSSPTWNKIGQEYGNLTGGNVAGKQFANTLNDFTGELVKFYRGTGGSEHDIEAAKEALDPSQSPAQLRAGIAQQAKLISGKVNALQSSWHQGMGPQAQDYPIIQPESQASLDRISQRAALSAPGAQQPAPTAASTQRLTPEQAKALPPGTPFVGTDGISRVRH